VLPAQSSQTCLEFKHHLFTALGICPTAPALQLILLSIYTAFQQRKVGRLYFYCEWNNSCWHIYHFIQQKTLIKRKSTTS